MALGNTTTRLMKELNCGAAYQNPHNDPGNFLNQEFFSEAIKAPSSYQTGDNARKQELRAFLSKR
jgi:replication-associated recombination protein RarA